MIKLINDTIDENDINKLITWLQTYPRLTKGPITKEFEEKWAKWLGTKFAVYCNSGSSANLLMLYALLCTHRLRNKKIVIPNLCWATDLAPAVQLGYEPILCEINMKNLSVDLNDLEIIFKKHTPSVLLLVSVLGLSPDMKAIQDLCDDYNVILLEDNCESIGTKFENVKLGNFGLMSSFSFYFGHHISTIEGGMVCTNDKLIYDILLSIRSHGWDRDWDNEKQIKNRKEYGVDDFNSLYTFYYPGFNLRSTDLQAYIGILQLEKLDLFIAKRYENFIKYQEEINTEWKPEVIKDTYTSNFAYPIIDIERNQIVKALQEEKIEVRPLICGSMSRQPFYRNIKSDPQGYTSMCRSGEIDKYGMYIPNHPALSNDDIDLIIDTINNVLC